MYPSQIFLISTLAIVFAAFNVIDAFVIDRQSRGTPYNSITKIPQSQLPKIYTTSTETCVTVLRSSPGDIKEDDTEDERIEDEENAEKSLFDKVNDFLDTPILDANNRSDQGALAEVLKEFVRDEPEIAQVTFSAIVVVILALLTRAIMSL